MSNRLLRRDVADRIKQVIQTPGDLGVRYDGPTVLSDAPVQVVLPIGQDTSATGVSYVHFNVVTSIDQEQVQIFDLPRDVSATLITLQVRYDNGNTIDGLVNLEIGFAIDAENLPNSDTNVEFEIYEDLDKVIESGSFRTWTLFGAEGPKESEAGQESQMMGLYGYHFPASARGYMEIDTNLNLNNFQRQAKGLLMLHRENVVNDLNVEQF